MKSQDIARMLARPDEREVAAGSVCPADEELAAYVEGAVEESARSRVEGHLAACRSCAAVIGLVISIADPETVRATPETTLARARRLVGKRQAPIRKYARWVAAAAVVVILAGVLISPFETERGPTPDVGDRAIRTISTQLPAPQLVTPLPGARVPVGAFEVEWAEWPGSLFYDVYIITDSGFLVRRERVAGTHWVPSKALDLTPGMEYFVRVDAYLSDTKTVSSAHVPFEVTQE